MKQAKSNKVRQAVLKTVEPLIINLRGQKVILDADLAVIYEVETRVLNQAVKRNSDRFPEDFMFQLTTPEWDHLKSQFVTSSWEQTGNKDATTSAHGGRRKLPYAFTEHGAMMAAMVLNSPEAVAMSVFVVRAFVRMREHLAANAAILKRLAEIDKTLLEHDQAVGLIWEQLQPLLAPPPEPPKKKIGFDFYQETE
jgi:hypothetical protein